MKRVIASFLGLILLVVIALPLKSSAATTSDGWEQVTEKGFGRKSALGAIYPYVTFLRFGDWLLAGSAGNRPAEMRKTQDGTTWEQVGERGLGDNENIWLHPALTYDNYLYVVTENIAEGGQIWRSNDLENWTRVVYGGFGVKDNYAITTVVNFKGQIYAGTYNQDIGGTSTGAEVWRSSNGVDNWEKVNKSGFGFPKQSTAIMAMKVYKDYLYVSTANYYNKTAQVWRTADGTSWEESTGNGFNDTRNDSIWIGEEFKGELYSGTGRLDTSLGKLYKTSNGLDWQEVSVPNQMNPEIIAIWPTSSYNGWLYISTSSNDMHKGAEVWRYNGSNWEQFAENGFGEKDTTASYIGPAFKDYIFAGTANWNEGGSIWRKYIGGVSAQGGDTGKVLPETGAKDILKFIEDYIS